MQEAVGYVELNGIRYLLATDFEGQHFSEEFQPLRAPNAQLVQGENKVNLRPDLLVWSWTDWSGGMFQYRFEPQSPNRYWQGYAIDSLLAPGSLRVAADWASTSAATTLTSPILVTGPDDSGANILYMTDVLTLYSMETPGGSWTSEGAITGGTTEILAADSDANHVYLLDVNSIIRFNDSLGGAGVTPAYTDFATTIPGVGSRHGMALVALGNYVYVVSMDETNGFEVMEYDKAATPPVTGTLIVDEPQLTVRKTKLAHRARFMVAKSHNRLYVAVPQNTYTLLYEIVPSTAAVGGYGRFIGRIEASISAITWANGLLYLATSPAPEADRTATVNPFTLMYINPQDGTYGAVDPIWPVDTSTFNARAVYLLGSNTLDRLHMAVFGLDSDKQTLHIFVVDFVTGAIHPVYHVSGLEAVPNQSSAAVSMGNFVLWAGRVYFSIPAGTSESRVYNSVPGSYEHTSPNIAATTVTYTPQVTSPLWDFGILKTKVLNSFHVSCDTIPTDWTVGVLYQIDESGTWVSAGTFTAGSEGGTLVVSTGASPITFLQMRVRVTFTYSGGGTPTTTPVLHGLETFASISDHLRAWTLILDLSDDPSHTGTSNLSGRRKINNLQSLADTGTIFVFKDNFSTWEKPNPKTYDVRMDSCRVVVDRPGQGVAFVQLVEVN